MRNDESLLDPLGERSNCPTTPGIGPSVRRCPDARSSVRRSPSPPANRNPDHLGRVPPTAKKGRCPRSWPARTVWKPSRHWRQLCGQKRPRPSLARLPLRLSLTEGSGDLCNR